MITFMGIIWVIILDIMVSLEDDRRRKDRRGW
jgi:hypothetical protein